MHTVRSCTLALAGLFLSSAVYAQFATGVVSYSAGTGVTSGYNDPTRALGSPTTDVGYQATDPFNPPYRKTDVVSVGTGGSLTLAFATPIRNAAGNPFGMDFIIFGNAGFIITNGDYSGGGITDGSLFSASAGVTRVSVSVDNVSYYTLDPALAPTVDTLFPTDAAGDFSLPVNPALAQSHFSGKDLGGIRSLYARSGGGQGFDVSWAQDASGASVYLPQVSYVRIDVLNDKSEIDAVSIVPEPSVLAVAALGALIANRRRRICRPK